MDQLQNAYVKIVTYGNSNVGPLHRERPTCPKQAGLCDGNVL